MNSNFDLVFTENWMQFSEHQIKSKKLIELKLIGAHDSNSHSLRKSFTNVYSKC